VILFLHSIQQKNLLRIDMSTPPPKRLRPVQKLLFVPYSYVVSPPPSVPSPLFFYFILELIFWSTCRSCRDPVSHSPSFALLLSTRKRNWIPYPYYRLHWSGLLVPPRVLALPPFLTLSSFLGETSQAVFILFKTLFGSSFLPVPVLPFVPHKLISII